MKSTPTTPPIDAAAWSDIVQVIDTMIAELPDHMKETCLVECVQRMQQLGKSEPFVRKRKQSGSSLSPAIHVVPDDDDMDGDNADDNTDDNAEDNASDDMVAGTSAVESEPEHETSHGMIVLFDPAITGQPTLSSSTTTSPARRSHPSVQRAMSGLSSARRMSMKTSLAEPPFPPTYKMPCKILAEQWDAVLAAELSRSGMANIDVPDAGHLRHFDFWIKMVVLQYYEEHTILPNPAILLEYIPDLAGMTLVAIVMVWLVV
jgi:hypothetical protein